MKKIVCMLLVVVMMFALAISAGAAVNSNTGSGTEEGVVKITVVSQNNTTKVYSVDIAWDSLIFTYSNGSGTWQPGDHSYAQSGQGWVADTGNGQVKVGDNIVSEVTVTNHSNANIWYTASYNDDDTPFVDANDVSVVLGGNYEDVQVDAGEVGQHATADKDVFTVTVGGNPGNTARDEAVDGTITISISPTAP